MYNFSTKRKHSYGLCVSGYKGLKTFGNIILKYKPKFVCSYSSNSFIDKVKTLCEYNNIPFVYKRDMTKELFLSVDSVYMVGWQFLIKFEVDNLFVVHDSLLPKYRGFCPSISALLNKDSIVGTSLIKPTSEVDAGPILLQEEINVKYPIKIKDYYEILCKKNSDMILNHIRCFSNSQCHSDLQDEKKATYSVWRDEHDYKINWNNYGEEICNFVNCLSFPYDGAFATYKGEKIRIFDCEFIKGYSFQEQHCGKIWKIENNYPYVTCLDGLIKLIDVKQSNCKNDVVFDKLRCRL